MAEKEKAFSNGGDNLQPLSHSSTVDHLVPGYDGLIKLDHEAGPFVPVHCHLGWLTHTIQINNENNSKTLITANIHVWLIQIIKNVNSTEWSRHESGDQKIHNKKAFWELHEANFKVLYEFSEQFLLHKGIMYSCFWITEAIIRLSISWGEHSHTHK